MTVDGGKIYIDEEVKDDIWISQSLYASKGPSNLIRDGWRAKLSCER